MTDFDPETEIEALVETYAAGFDDYESEAIAACFAYPAVIWQMGKGHVFADAEEMIENTAALLKAYEEAGIVASAFDLLTLTVSGDAALATVTWEMEDGEGVVVMETVCHYQFLRQGGDWRIATIVNVDEEDEGEED
jgi:ketosteroid isomerase-like protein